MAVTVTLVAVAAFLLVAGWLLANVPNNEPADLAGLRQGLEAFEAPAGAVDSGTEVVPCSPDGSSPPGAGRSFSGFPAEDGPGLLTAYTAEALNQGWTPTHSARQGLYNFEKGNLDLQIFLDDSTGGQRRLWLSASHPSAVWGCP